VTACGFSNEPNGEVACSCPRKISIASDIRVAGLAGASIVVRLNSCELNDLPDDVDVCGVRDTGGFFRAKVP
jgi:hypothetical protein